MNYKEALKIAGSLSHPSKMPCPAWGIDPKHCKTGSKLRETKGTTCSVCYACKGHYCYPKVRDLQEKRFQGIKHPQWVDAMITLIQREGNQYFRWFDSGDLQGYLHLIKIMIIAIRMPNIKFWLPTQEHQLIEAWEHTVPDNLIIRVTNPVINPVKPLKAIWQAEVRTEKNTGYHCPASWTEQKNCENCRACWDKSITKIIYRRH